MLAESWIEGNSALWAFLALPLAAAAAIAGAMPLIRDWRQSRWSTTVALTVLSRAVEVETSREGRLDFGEVGLLAPRLRDASGGEYSDGQIELFSQLKLGKLLRITGPAGSGKSVLSSLVTQYSVNRFRAGAAGPVVVVLKLQNWRPSWIDNAGGDLMKWAVRELNRKYPQLGKRTLGDLITTQAVVLCLDGSDEIKADHLASFERSIERFIEVQPGAGIAVFGRVKASQIAYGVHFEEAREVELYDERFLLLPVGKGPIAAYLSSNLNGAGNAHRDPAPIALIRLFNTPLFMWMGRATFGDDVIENLRGSNDPQRELVDKFIALHLPIDGPGRMGRSQKLGIAGLAGIRMRYSATPARRLREVLHHRTGTLLAFAVCGTAVMLFFWRRDAPSAGIVSLLTLYVLANPLHNWTHNFRHNYRVLRTWNWFAAAGALIFVGYIASRTLYRIWLSFARARVRIVDGGVDPLREHIFEWRLTRIWLQDQVWVIFTSAFDPISPAIWIAVTLATLTFLPQYGDFREEHLVKIFPIGWLGSLHAWAPYLALFLFGGIAASGGSPMGALICALLLFPILATAFGAVALWAGGWIEPRRIRSDMSQLRERGVLVATSDGYRFRHPLIEDAVAQWALDRLVEPNKLKALRVGPQAVMIGLDERIRPESLASASKTATAFRHAYPRSRAVANQTAMLDAWGEGRYDVAHSTLSSVVGRKRDRGIGIQLAEVELELGMTASADRRLHRMLPDGPQNDFELNRWVRVQQRLGKCDRIRDLLESDAPFSRTPFAKLLRAETADRDADSDLVDELLGSSEAIVRHRAALLAVRLGLLGNATRSAVFLAKLLEEGELYAATVAQLALVQQERGRLATAKDLARFAYSLLEWNDDPRSQVFVLEVVSLLQPDVEAAERLKQLRDHGWSSSFACT